ncbi:MAG: zinc ribbon domain-containing protein [Fibrobacteria bacterium]|nr:zinc ribbon domain-containing protein [Fibrobacteria bacterium]
MNDDGFVCPNCGAELPASAKFCPECGSDDRTGWSEDTYLDGVTLPGEEDDVPPGTPTGTLDRSRPLWIAVAVLLLALAALFLLVR